MHGGKYEWSERHIQSLWESVSDWNFSCIAYYSVSDRLGGYVMNTGPYVSGFASKVTKFLYQNGDRLNIHTTHIPEEHLVGDCIWCGAKESLLFSFFRYLPKLMWGYCRVCQQSRQLPDDNDPTGGTTKWRSTLWNIYQEQVKIFRTTHLPASLSAVLGISYKSEDPLKHLFLDSFVGYVPEYSRFYWTIRQGLGITTVKSKDKEGPRSAHKPALIIPVCRFPGFLSSFQIILEGRMKHLLVDQYSLRAVSAKPVNQETRDNCKMYVHLESFADNWPYIHYKDFPELISKHTFKVFMGQTQENITCGAIRGTEFFEENSGFGFPEETDFLSEEC